MKFSIFTSFYNYLDTFDNLVESVFSQTHEDWEWIISDDFSENPEVDKKINQLLNKSHKIKRAYPTFKKEFYYTPPIYLCTGDIILVLDSDDMMTPKLLEVYDYNFKMFPDVFMLSCNSDIRNGSVNGTWRATRYINYRENKNVVESLHDKTYEYNWGDCRAWRNSIKSFDKNKKWRGCAEDLLKILRCEEQGKILFIPRILSIYAWREDSISHIPVDMNIIHEAETMIEEANKRVSRNSLNSIEKFYDNIFFSTMPFYSSSLNYSRECFRIHTFPEPDDALKKLYFDHDFVAQKYQYFLATITDEIQIDIVVDILKKELPSIQIIIESKKEFIEKINTAFSWISCKHSEWKLYQNYTIIFNL